MTGPASKRPHSPDKMANLTDQPPSGGEFFEKNVGDRATARSSPSEKKKRTKARHDRYQSNLEEDAVNASAGNQSAVDSRRMSSSGLQAKYLLGSQPKSYPETRDTSSPLRSSSESKSSSISNGMKAGSSVLTTPEDSGIQTQIDVSELRTWWANLKSKNTECDKCGSTAVFENITTDYIREQLDAEYAISTSVKAAEKVQRQKKLKEDELREEAFIRSRWGKGKKLGENRDEKERENIHSLRGKGKETQAIGNKKLGRLLGVASCPDCDSCICLGCLKPLEDSQVATLESLESTTDEGDPKAQKAGKSHLSKSDLWCCDEGRVVAITLILACLDEDTLGLSLGDNHLNNDFPGKRGFGGAVKRGIRSLKDKIAENTLPRSPSHKSKSKSKVAKGNGTGYGSGGYGNPNSLFGLDFHEPEDWEEVDTSGSDEPENDDPPPFPPYTTMPTIAPVGHTPHMPPSFNSQKFASTFPSVHFTGLGQKLGGGSATPNTKNGLSQIAGPSTTDYIDLTMDDPPPPTFISPLATLGRGVSFMGPSSLQWAGGHSSFSPRGRGVVRGRGGAHHLIHFSGSGQTLGGTAAPISKVQPLPANSEAFPTVENLPYYHPSDWEQNFSQYPGATLPQEILDDLLTNALVNPNPNANPNLLVDTGLEKLPDLSGAGLASIQGPTASSSYSLSPPIPPPLSSLTAFIGSGSGFIKPRSNTRDKVAQGIPSPPPLSPEQTKHDRTLVAVISLLTELLPKSLWDSLFDIVPPPPLKTMLKTSMLVEKAEELLRNDSVQDISLHSEIYIALMGLLRRICACSETEFLVMERRKKKLHTIGILKILQSLPIPDDALGSGPKTRGKIAAAAEEKRRAEVLIYEQNSDRKTLIEVSTNLCTQAKFFLKGVEKSEGADFDGVEATKILGICLEIVGIKEEFEKLASRALHSNIDSSSGGASHNKNKHPAVPISTRKKRPSQLGFEYHSPIAFEYTENVLNTHRYKAQAHDLKQSPRGRVLHLTRELATMSTSLPQGIFVRVEDSRPDVLKALIVGPGGTPYEGGLYEFDIWAPMEYPVTPPLCIFKTTGDGSVHFNPNLYNCGKVCLSILNTWEGAASEKWQPAMSTLLQVFVSIQSMIFCENPWYNEPGRREGTQKKQSDEFNAKVKLNNVRFAMLDWIRDPEKRNGVWKDVIKAHFTENRTYVLDLIKGWAKKDPSIHDWRRGMGSLYGVGPGFWPDDYLAGTAIGGRRLAGEAIPSIPTSMDMVAEMEKLTEKLGVDENED